VTGVARRSRATDAKPQALGPASATGNGQVRQHTARISAPLRQRRRGWFAGSIALLALAALTNVYLFQSASDRVPAVVVVRDVPIGQEITSADLGTTRIPAASGVRMVPGSQLPEVVGNRAAVDLRQGSLLTPSQLTGDVTPRPGQALVTVAVKPSQLPPRGLTPGTPVSVIATPGAQGQEGTGGGAAVLTRDVPAIVDQVAGPDVEGFRSISLIVAQADAAAVARQASTGRVAVIVTARQ
jgi:hypothetical protein